MIYYDPLPINGKICSKIFKKSHWKLIKNGRFGGLPARRSRAGGGGLQIFHVSSIFNEISQYFLNKFFCLQGGGSLIMDIYGGKPPINVHDLWPPYKWKNLFKTFLRNIIENWWKMEDFGAPARRSRAGGPPNLPFFINFQWDFSIFFEQIFLLTGGGGGRKSWTFMGATPPKNVHDLWPPYNHHLFIPSCVFLHRICKKMHIRVSFLHRTCKKMHLVPKK